MLADVGYLPLVTHCHSVEPYLFGPSCCVLEFFCGPSPTEADLAPNRVDHTVQSDYPSILTHECGQRLHRHYSSLAGSQDNV